VRIGVRDNGVGIADEDIPAAIQRFSQLSPASGSGLGLPIVEAIAHGHGGTLHVRPGNPGLTVELELPVEGPRAQVQY
jgi:signal transduction histidine kinase